MDLYYLLLKITHLIGMASWFGVALAISIILSKKDKNDYELILDLSTKIEMPASFFMPLTGVLMMIENTDLITMSWLHLKILISLLAVLFTHLSRSHLIHSDLNNTNIYNKFIFYRNMSLFTVLSIIIFVGYK
jgi:uncharacterized membrane protein|tara:strand:- start:718 stop:1116 length:399 start_codon:yes stop_codon:yes gene_type:complete